QQLGSRKLLRRPNQAPLTLYRRHNVAQVHVQTALEVPPLCAIASAHQVVSILSVMKGWFVFHTRRVPVLPALYNPSWHLTAPPRNASSVFATTPWISSRCPASLVRLKLVRCPHSLAPTLVVLPSMSLGPPLHSLGSRATALMLFNASRGLSLSRSAAEPARGFFVHLS